MNTINEAIEFYKANKGKMHDCLMNDGQGWYGIKSEEQLRKEFQRPCIEQVCFRFERIPQDNVTMQFVERLSPEYYWD